MQTNIPAGRSAAFASRKPLWNHGLASVLEQMDVSTDKRFASPTAAAAVLKSLRPHRPLIEPWQQYIHKLTAKRTGLDAGSSA